MVILYRLLYEGRYMFITKMIMRDVNNGWLIRYTHGASCDGIFEQTDFVEKIICLLSVIP
jgi:hypothetical protein